MLSYNIIHARIAALRTETCCAGRKGKMKMKYPSAFSLLEKSVPPFGGEITWN